MKGARRSVDPLFNSVFLVAGALTLIGFAMLVLTWRGVARHLTVYDQVPVVVSGGFGGVALVGLSVGAVAIQSRRLAEARRRAAFELMVQAAAELVEAVSRDVSRSHR